MNTRDAFTARNIVDWLLEQAPSSDAKTTEIESDVDATVRAIARQRALEEVAAGEVNKRLARIERAAQKLASLLNAVDPVTHSARRAMEGQVGEAKLEEFQKRLEYLASGQGLKDTEFEPALETNAEKFASRVREAAGQLRALLSERSPFARAMRSRLRASAIEDLRRRLQGLAAVVKSVRVPTQEQRSAFFASAEVARYGTKLSSGGRPIETAKHVAVWNAYMLLLNLGLPLTDDPDGPLCRLPAMCYEVATGERDADLSHWVKGFLQDLHAWKVID